MGVAGFEEVHCLVGEVFGPVSGKELFVCEAIVGGVMVDRGFFGMDVG